MSDQQSGDGGLDDLLGNLLGGGGGGLGDLLGQAQQAMAASQAAAEQEVEGTSGGGVVRIRANGNGDVLSVELSPAVVDPDDIETLQDLVVAAFRDVRNQIGALHEAALGGLGGLGDIGGVLGGGVIDVEGDG